MRRCAAPLVEHGAADEAKIMRCAAMYDLMYRDADKSLALPTSRCILFDDENISLMLVLLYIYIYIYIVLIFLQL